MKNQLKAIVMLLFSLLLFGFSVQRLWLPILGDISEVAEYAALACGIFGVYLAFRRED